MPRAKKASPKKSMKNAANKSHSKKKLHKEDASLHQAFTNSLTALENFWSKRSATLKKQLDALRAKQEKMNLKRKAAKAKSDSANKTQLKKQATDTIQMELAQSREALAYAKLNSSKYAALSKLIDQHDKDWQKKLADVMPAAAPTPKAKKATKASKAVGKKRGRKPKMNATPDALPEETLLAFEEQPEDAEEVMVENTKKRGRKSKANAHAPMAQESPMFAMENELVESLQDDETLEDDLSLEDELLIPLDEEFSELRIIDDSSSDLLDDEDYA